MSVTLQNVYGALPATTRGKPVHLGPDPKGNNFLYTCGTSVFIRSIKDPLKCELYSEHQFPTTVARYAPSGFYIASGDNAGVVRIWDTTQKEHPLKLEIKILSGPILDLQWSDDSKRIVAVGDGKEKFGAVFLWDSGSSVGEISGHSKMITSCDFKQTRPYRVATGSEDFQVGWFEGPPFKFKKALKDHSRFVNCVRFSPDGEKLVSVGSDKLGFIYDGKEGNPIGKLSTSNGHNGGIYSCSFSPDSKQLVTASADKTSKIWDITKGECVQTFTFADDIDHQQLGCLWQGNDILSVSLNGEIAYLDPSNPSKPKRVLHGHNKFVTSLTFDHSTKNVFTASYDGSIVQWGLDGQTQIFNGKGHSNLVAALGVQGNNLISIGMDDSLRVTPINSHQYGEAIGLEAPGVGLAIGRKDQKLIVAVTQNRLVILREGQIVTKQDLKFTASCVALSVDETLIAVGSKENSIHFFSLQNGKVTDTNEVLKKHKGAVNSVAFSPDGKYLASSDQNREIIIWDAKSHQVAIEGWVFHNARVNSVAWSPDSVHLASGGLDGLIIVWNVQETSKRLIVKEAHHGGVNQVYFLDDSTLASIGQDCSLKTWTIKS